jgi:hypothetical protein
LLPVRIVGANGTLDDGVYVDGILAKAKEGKKGKKNRETDHREAYAGERTRPETGAETTAPGSD